MRTAIDSAERVVIPKALRDALRLTAGQPLEIAERELLATGTAGQIIGGLSAAPPAMP